MHIRQKLKQNEESNKVLNWLKKRDFNYLNFWFDLLFWNYYTFYSTIVGKENYVATPGMHLAANTFAFLFKLIYSGDIYISSINQVYMIYLDYFWNLFMQLVVYGIFFGVVWCVELDWSCFDRLHLMLHRRSAKPNNASVKFMEKQYAKYNEKITNHNKSIKNKYLSREVLALITDFSINPKFGVYQHAEEIHVNWIWWHTTILQCSCFIPVLFFSIFL